MLSNLLANACDFGHTSLLNSRLDWHPIAPGHIFQAGKSVGWTYPQLLEAKIPWMHSPQINRQKVRFPASVQRKFLLDRNFSFRMPSRSARDGRCKILHPVKDFFCHRVDSVTIIHRSNKKNEMIELPIDSDNPNVGNLGPNSAPTLPQFAVSAIISIA
ncbi:hypothetical protein D0A37_01610 [Microcoleus vaginatus HSN003]|nr:hypothetical protein D0A37_01610 [Microcoleus vaginatus HSN003]